MSGLPSKSTCSGSVSYHHDKIDKIDSDDFCSTIDTSFQNAISEDDGIAMEQEDTSREVLKETPNLDAKVN
ncbi:hypothetical protein ANCCAN_29169 [Ancylostoma caninum]|uniref:Uncharacterized protein n=1 Tax=Ancylostoma caninum TaxID=29170 RepID=A0A368EZ70_ANCCA|nr:hypothetical protein ANCCAN_29169 [Ancylostoma caninum]